MRAAFFVKLTHANFIGSHAETPPCTWNSASFCPLRVKNPTPAKRFKPHIIRRLLCLSIFWHALDIIWVAIFTIVYLIGTLQ